MQIKLSDHFTYGRLLRYTLPSIIMMIFTSLYSVVDGLFVSNFVGKVAFAGGGQRPVQRHAVGVRIVTAFGETFGGFLGTHRVAARRAVPDFV